jgi:hypothetical protein
VGSRYAESERKDKGRTEPVLAVLPSRCLAWTSWRLASEGGEGLGGAVNLDHLIRRAYCTTDEDLKGLIDRSIEICAVLAAFPLFSSRGPKKRASFL